jgi:O-antigen ligase
MRAVVSPRPRGFAVSPVIAVAACCVAVVTGLLAAANPLLGVAAPLGVLVVAVAVIRPIFVTYLLVITTFTNALTVGSVAIGRVAGPLALLAAVSQILHDPPRLRTRDILTMAGGYVLLAIASLIWSVSFSGTLDDLTALGVAVAHLIVFAVTIRDRKQLNTLLWVVTICSVVLALIWIGGYASGIDRRVNATGAPNFFAALQIMSLPLVLVLITSVRDSLVRIALHIAVAIIAGSIISTLSRGGFLTLLVMGAVIMVLPTRSLFRSPGHKLAVFLAAAIGLSILLGLAWTDLSRRFEIGFQDENIAGARGDLWRAAVEGYKEEPVMGLGFGGFRSMSFQLVRTTPGTELEGHLRFIDTGEYVHNAYLGSLVDLGPLGLFFFLGMLLTSARSFIRTGRRADPVRDQFLRSFCIGASLSLLAVSISSLSLSTETFRALWILVGIAIALPSLIPDAGTQDS